jgi:hypothetical protein
VAISYYVLTGRVDQRVVRIEVSVVDWEAPIVGEQRHDRCRLDGVATELTLVVVSELDVLRGAERIQRPLARLHLGERVHATGDEDESEDCQDDSYLL